MRIRDLFVKNNPNNAGLLYTTDLEGSYGVKCSMIFLDEIATNSHSIPGVTCITIERSFGAGLKIPSKKVFVPMTSVESIVFE